MKILGIGFNYASHRDEATQMSIKSISGGDEPIIFHKGDSLLRPNMPFYLPDWSKQIDYEVELVVQICRVGKYIAPRFAHRYYQHISVGIDFTARDLQRKAIAEGKPWSLSKAFDSSAAVGKWIDKAELGYPDRPIEFGLRVDGREVQRAQSDQMIFGIDALISYISQYHTLKMGDLIFTGTPAGVGTCAIGQKLEAFIGDLPLLEVDIK